MELHNTTRCQELGPRFGPLISAVLAGHLAQEQRLKAAQKQKTRRVKRV